MTVENITDFGMSLGCVLSVRARFYPRESVLELSPSLPS